MRKIVVSVILLFSFFIFPFFISPFRLGGATAQGACTYQVLASIVQIRTGEQKSISISGDPGHYNIAIRNTATNQTTIQGVDLATSPTSFPITFNEAGVFEVKVYFLPNFPSVDGLAPCGVVNNNDKVFVVGDLVFSECHVSADPKTISNFDRNTTVTVTDLTAGTKYYFDIILVAEKRNFYSVEKTAGSDGKVEFRASSSYYLPPEDGVQKVVDLPEGDYTVSIRLAASGESTSPTPVLCTQQGVVFTVTKVALGEAGGPERQGNLLQQIDTPFGTIDASPEGLAKAFLSLGVGAAGGVAFLLMVFGAYRLIFAGGNPESIKEGRSVMTAAIAGLIVVILAIFLLDLIGISILGLNII